MFWNILIFLFVIFQTGNVFSRCSFLIIEKKTDKVVGTSMAYTVDNIDGSETHSLIYILEDGNKYIEFKGFIKSDYKAISYLHWKQHIMWKNTGIENMYTIFIKVKEKEFKYTLFGDNTYLYLMDENGSKKMNKDAIEHIIKKDSDIIKFFEILLSTRFKFDNPFQYVFDKEKAAEKLQLKRKKYKFKDEYIPCTEVEKRLGYDCDKYINRDKKYQNCASKKTNN